jgi:hypothetical protein
VTDVTSDPDLLKEAVEVDRDQWDMMHQGSDITIDPDAEEVTGALIYQYYNGSAGKYYVCLLQFQPVEPGSHERFPMLRFYRLLHFPKRVYLIPQSPWIHADQEGGLNFHKYCN